MRKGFEKKDNKLCKKKNHQKKISFLKVAWNFFLIRLSEQQKEKPEKKKKKIDYN